MRKFLRQFIGLAAVAGMTGCTNVAVFDYAGAPGSMIRLREAGSATKSIAVLPVMDQRGVKYADPKQAGEAAAHPAGDHGSFYLGFIPLFPFGFVEKEEPEISDDFVSLGRFHFDPAQDLSEAAMVSLRTSNLFSSVVKANTREQAQTDYLWRTTVTSTCYRGYMLSYCITYFLAPGLWIIGAPSGVSHNELQLRFELVERAGGKVVWSYDYSGRDYIVHWLYARIGQDVCLYPRLMKQAMNGALFDLNRQMENRK